MIEQIKIGGREFRFNTEGLNGELIKPVRVVSFYVLDRLSRDKKWALDRCTFFASYGYDYLQRAATLLPRRISNERIEGCDENPFDQHYWLAFDVSSSGKPITRDILIDPVFNYIGLESSAGDVLKENICKYYSRKRFVPANTAHENGGIRIKTIGL